MDISHQKKSDALATFKQFKAMAELQFGTPLNELGVIHRLICTHTHTTKMVVNVNIGILLSLVSLLSHTSLPIKFYDYVFQTAVFLINRLPTSSLEFVIPYTVLFKQKPDFNFLKVFGCGVHVFLYSGPTTLTN